MTSFYYIYWAICFVVLLLVIFHGAFFDFKKKYSQIIDNNLFFFLVIFAISSFGFRNENIGTDTSTYLYSFRDIVRFTNVKGVFESELAQRDPFFYSYMLVISRFFGSSGFLFITAGLYLIPIAFVFYKLFKRDKAFAIIFFLLLDVSINMGINIIRTGLGISFSMLFMYFLINKKSPLLYILLGLIAVGFHQSSIIIIGIFLIARYLKVSITYYNLALLGAFVLSILQIGIVQFPVIGDYLISNERFASYSDPDISAESSGMSLYIIVFFGFTLSLIYYFRKRMIKGNELYNYFSKSFILALIVYFLCIDLNYSYRFGVFAYALLPFVIIYPFSISRFKSLNYLKLTTIILIYFMFSLYRVLPNL